ncbi:MAG: methyltransferase domain-containing protein [Phycisphaerae bacterium]|nr:methyltransferase domain-containing protein [Phycisphaerae bacterium]
MPDPDPRIAFFDRLAPQWDADQPPIAETLARLDQLQPTLGLQAGDDVLEVGCGTGLVTNWLLEQVRPGRVTALDFSPAMIAHAQARGVEAEFRHADVCSDDLGRALYDLVWCMHVFPHFRDQAAALRHLARALKPGGALLVLHLDSRQTINAFHDRIGGPVAGDHLPDPQSWETLLADAGLRIAELIERDDVFCLRAARAA